ncbi:MAG: hypothetical protein IJI07_01315 [Flexilinea sp.]|nr:hypothetical protein [Flexilinea sp.]
MTKREKRVINAFINCVKTGEYTLDYAILLIEDNTRYGWLSEEAKEVFYEAVDPEPEEVILIEPEDEPAEDLTEEPEE